MGNGSHLEPMGIGEILDKTLELFKKDFKKYYIITFIGYLPFLLLTVTAAVATIFFSRPRQSQDFPVGLVAGIIITVIPAVIGIMVMQGGLTKACADSLFNRKSSIRECLRFGLKKAFPFFVTIFLLGLATLCGYLLLIIPGLMLTVWFALAAPVTFLEDSGYAGALGRSRRLVRGYFWRTLGFVIVLGLLGFALIGGFSQAASLIPLVGQFIGMLIQMAVVPLQTIALTLYYYNQRVVREGYDLELRADRLYNPPGGDVSIV